MATSNNGKTAQDLLDRVLLGKPEETKAKVLELVLRLGINPQDELFLIMIALNHLQVLIEDAPHDWQALFIEFSGELAEWSEVNRATLDSIIRKAEHEEILAKTSQQLVTSLSDLTAFSKELMKRLGNSPPLSSSSTQTLPVREFSDQLQNIIHTQNQVTDRLNRIQHASSQRSNTKATLPPWLLFLLAMLTISSFYNYNLLNNIHERLTN